LLNGTPSVGKPAQHARFSIKIPFMLPQTSKANESRISFFLQLFPRR
jgi:hypothetical protein